MLNHRDFLLHPTSMQSLVSSSGGGGPSGGGGSGGASNPGLRIAESYRHENEVDEESVYCDLTRPCTAANTGGRNQQNSVQQSVSGTSATRRERPRTPAPSAATKRISCLRTGLLAAFVLILLGVIVTSSYAIDRRLSQMPQLLYIGLGLCSVGLCLIVVCISLLVARQLGKQQQQQRQRQRRQSAARRSASARQRDASAGQSSNRVPIWYIGCHRDTATAYCPPVPPSYWDSTSAATSASVAASNSPKLLRQVAPPPPPPPPQQQHSRLQRVLPPPPPQPPLPPSPPSYQEALRCLEQRSPQQPPEHHQIRPSSSLRQFASRQPGLASSDQMSVLKWTVQSQHHHQLHHQRLQQQQQQQQQLSSYRSYQRQNSVESSMRRCESSSFIGEPILV